MKAYMHLQNTGKGRFGGHPIRLTVAMIVKNEEKTLDKCLNSLKPLLDAVPSELIITDTGSADSTVEIAEKYTDKILHFDWCGDFSAARNTGVKAARGEWFMFIDGDEWFENTDGIISFFNSGECDKYGSASYIQRNYAQQGNDKVYSDFHALRILKFYPGMRFKGLVHEWVPWMKPIKIINSYVHHYGYAFKSDEDRFKKAKRNIPLLKKDIEADKYDLKSYYQIGKEYLVIKKYDKAIAYSKEMLEIEKGHKNKIWRLSTMHNLISAYYLLKQFDKLIKTADDFLKENPDPEIIYLDFLFFANDAAFRLKQYDKAIDFGEKYLDIYEKYKSGKLDESMLVYSDFLFIKEENQQRLLLTLIWSYLLQNDNTQREKAVPLFGKLDIANPVNNSVYSIRFTAAQLTGKWGLLSDFYKKILLSGDNESKSKFIGTSEQYMLQNTDKAANVVDVISSLQEEDAYIYLNRLRRDESSDNRTEALKVFKWFTENEKAWNDKLSDVIYFAMKEKINIMPYLLRIDTDDLKYFVIKMQKTHKDFTKTVMDYFDMYSFENLKGLYFTVIMKEKVLIFENGLSSDEYICLFKSYAVETARYTRMLLRREMFLPANIPALPRAYRFGYYIGEAFEDKKRLDEASYLKNLRFALEAYPIMKEPVSILLDEARKGIEEKNEKATEFASLARKVKLQIESLIKNGDLKQAGSITEQLAKLMPNDSDVIRYRKLTHTEPSMAELASNLPQ